MPASLNGWPLKRCSTLASKLYICNQNSNLPYPSTSGQGAAVAYKTIVNDNDLYLL